jgi:hypothetical protein
MHSHICSHIHTHLQTHRCTHSHSHALPDMHMQTHVLTHMLTYTHTHTLAHTHTHTQLAASLAKKSNYVQMLGHAQSLTDDLWSFNQIAKAHTSRTNQQATYAVILAEIGKNKQNEEKLKATWHVFSVFRNALSGNDDGKTTDAPLPTPLETLFTMQVRVSIFVLATFVA